jgi:hypothetical protein
MYPKPHTLTTCLWWKPIIQVHSQGMNLQILTHNCDIITIWCQSWHHLVIRTQKIHTIIFQQDIMGANSLLYLYLTYNKMNPKLFFVDNYGFFEYLFSSNLKSHQNYKKTYFYSILYCIHVHIICPNFFGHIYLLWCMGWVHFQTCGLSQVSWTNFKSPLWIK